MSLNSYFKMYINAIKSKEKSKTNFLFDYKKQQSNTFNKTFMFNNNKQKVNLCI